MHLDHFLGTAHRQFEVQHRLRADGQHDPGLHQVPEAGFLCRNVVRAHRQIWDRIASLSVGNGGIGIACASVFRLNFHAHNHRAAGIHGGAGKYGCVHLRRVNCWRQGRSTKARASAQQTIFPSHKASLNLNMVPPLNRNGE